MSYENMSDEELIKFCREINFLSERANLFQSMTYTICLVISAMILFFVYMSVSTFILCFIMTIFITWLISDKCKCGQYRILKRILINELRSRGYNVIYGNGATVYDNLIIFKGSNK